MSKTTRNVMTIKPAYTNAGHVQYTANIAHEYGVTYISLGSSRLAPRVVKDTEGFCSIVSTRVLETLLDNAAEFNVDDIFYDTGEHLVKLDAEYICDHIENALLKPNVDDVLYHVGEWMFELGLSLSRISIPPTILEEYHKHIIDGWWNAFNHSSKQGE